MYIFFNLYILGRDITGEQYPKVMDLTSVVGLACLLIFTGSVRGESEEFLAECEKLNPNPNGMFQDFESTKVTLK